ncbi:MAG: FHA domain-containing protein [Blastocatellia bacterium]
MIGQEHTRLDDPTLAVSLGKGRATTSYPAGKLSLTFFGGLCAGRPGLQLNQASVLIGRDEECHVVLDGDTVSRRHCEILRWGVSYVLQDASRNGTFLNGNRIQQAQLKDGDQIRVGQNILLVNLSSGFTTHGVKGKMTTPHNAPPVIELNPHIVVKGLEPGVTQSFSEPRLTIGRREDNRVVLEADNISRHHATVERRDDHYAVRDLGSANGTWLNDRRIEAAGEASLKDGDRLRIGNFTALVNLLEQDCILIFKKATK